MTYLLEQVGEDAAGVKTTAVGETDLCQLSVLSLDDSMALSCPGGVNTCLALGHCEFLE